MTRLSVLRFVIMLVLIVVTIPLGRVVERRYRAGPAWFVNTVETIVLTAKVFLAQIAFFVLLRVLFATINLNDPRP